MGWKGVLRSAAAASRAAERNRNRLANAGHRAREHVDRVVNGLDDEINRDLEQVAKFESQILAKPLTAGGVEYHSDTGQWTFKELADTTGQLKWSLTLEFDSDPVSAVDTIVDGGCRYALRAMAVIPDRAYGQ